MIKNVIFDFDGTLADTAPVILATMQDTIAELALPPRSEDECRSMIGLPLERIPDELWPGMPELSARFAATYRRIFDRKRKDMTAPLFDGVAETLRALHGEGYGLAVATSRSHASLGEYVEMYGLMELFSYMVGGNDVERCKPWPDPIEKICAHTGWSAGECLMVGDEVYDIEMGHNAGCKTCAVTYGNMTREQLASSHPHAMIDTFRELLAVVKE